MGYYIINSVGVGPAAHPASLRGLTPSLAGGRSRASYIFLTFIACRDKFYSDNP